MGNKPMQDCGFFLFGRRESQTPCYFCWIVGAGGATTHCFLYLCVQSGGFRVFLAFCAHFFSDLFPWTSKVCLLLAVWGATLLEEAYPRWASACNVAEDLLGFLFFLLLQLATGS